jgi:hypothetical protein
MCFVTYSNTLTTCKSPISILIAATKPQSASLGEHKKRWNISYAHVISKLYCDNMTWSQLCLSTPHWPAARQGNTKANSRVPVKGNRPHWPLQEKKSMDMENPNKIILHCWRRRNVTIPEKIVFIKKDKQSITSAHTKHRTRIKLISFQTEISRWKYMRQYPWRKCLAMNSIASREAMYGVRKLQGA